MRLGLGFRLGLVAAGLVLVGVLLLGGITLKYSADVLYEHELTDLGNDATLSARNFMTPIRTMTRDLLQLSRRHEVEKAVERLRAERGQGSPASPAPAPQPDLEAVLADYLRKNTYCIEAAFVATTPTPVELARVTRTRGGHRRAGADDDDQGATDPAIAPLADLKPRDDRRVRDTARTPPQDVDMSGIEFIEWEEKRIPAIHAGIALHRSELDGSSDAVLLLTIDLRPLFEQLMNSPRSVTFLADEKGEFLIHPSYPGEILPAGREPLKIEDEKALLPPEGDDGSMKDVRALLKPDPKLTRDGQAERELKLEREGELLSARAIPLPYRFYYAEAKEGSLRSVEGGPPISQETLDKLQRRFRKLDRSGEFPGLSINATSTAKPVCVQLFEGGDGDMSALMRRIEEIVREVAKVDMAWRTDWTGIWPDKVVECETFGVHLAKLHLMGQERSDRFLTLLTASSREEMTSDIYASVADRIVVWALPSALGAGLVAFLLARLVTHRLRTITTAAHAIAQGEDAGRLPVKDRSEVGGLARAFEHMASQIRTRTEQLRAGEERLKTILATLAEGIVTFDDRQEIVSLNRAALQMFGYDREEALHGRPPEALGLSFPDDAGPASPAGRPDAEPERKPIEAREATGVRGDGGRFDMEFSVSRFELAGRRMSTCTVRDVTERKQALAEIHQLNQNLDLRVKQRTAELEAAMEELHATMEELSTACSRAEAANKAKSEFLANMNHELRTPLNAIIGYGELIQEEAQDQGHVEYLPDLEKIIDSGRHLKELIDDVLDISKIEAGKMVLDLQSFDVGRLLDEVIVAVEPQSMKNGNTLAIDRDDDLGGLYSDPKRVRQVLINLMGNAAKFTSKGRVRLEARREGGEAEGDGRMVFRVQDTGIGMTPEQTAALFQPFTQADATTTRRYGGTGLGLAISKTFVEMMGGTISVDSEFGVGSTFTVSLPSRAPEPAPRAHETADNTAPPPGADTVLVIDDDPTVCELMDRFLSRQGYHVLTARTGDEGIRLAREHQPMAITLDVMMPDMDGWVVLSALKNDPALFHIPVVMATIVDEKGVGYALGASDYMIKPIDRRRLIKLLERYRGEGEGGSHAVLVVDDNASTREIIRRGLEKEGWSIAEASNGQEALDFLAEGRPDLIILDLMMPEMDGFEFVVQLRAEAKWRSIPVIVITAKNLDPDDHLLLSGRVDRILQKGQYSRDALLGEMTDLIRVLTRPVEPASPDGLDPGAGEASAGSPAPQA